jgi:hypothetical protein
MVLTSKMLTCGNPATDDLSDRCRPLVAVRTGTRRARVKITRHTGRSLPQDIKAKAGIPSRRQACLEADQWRGSKWSTQRLNDMDPLHRSATPPAPTRWDTRALATPTTIQSQSGSHTERRPAGGRHVC